tara:strand:+ start:4294 stop:4572 length:279 start_codon:yes stop_codon:yes gene_type:complete
MFMIPDGDSWLDPSTGETVDMQGFSADASREAIEKTEEGFRKHPLPINLVREFGAKHGQLSGDDYRLLLKNGYESADIAQRNSMYLLNSLKK